LNSEKFFNRVEAAAYLGVSTRTLHRYTKRGLLTHIRIGRRVLYKREWLDAFFQSMTVKAKSHSD